MTATEIIAAIESTNYAYYALRVTDGENLSVGDDLRRSRMWDNGNVVTDDNGEPLLLDGTSGVIIGERADGEIAESAVQRALDVSRIYYGDQILLIGGNYMQYGQDADEVIVRDARVVAIINN